MGGLRDQVIGVDTMVPTSSGGLVRYVNLDNAARHPRCVPVRDAIEQLLPCYGSVHRGAGHHARRCTMAFELARRIVGRFRRRRPGARRRRVHEEHDRGDQQARPFIAARRRRGGADHRPRAPLERPAVAGTGRARCTSGVSPTARSTSTTSTVSSPVTPGACALLVVVGRVQRHRRHAADPRAGREGCTPPAAGSSSTPPNSPRTARSTCDPTTIPVTSTSSRCRRTRCTRRTAAARSSARAPGSAADAGPPRRWHGRRRHHSTTSPGPTCPDREEAGSPNVLGAVALRRGHSRRLGEIGSTASSPTSAN